MTDDLTVIFMKGADAARELYGVGRWRNPYLAPWVDAKRRGEPTEGWEQKFKAWDDGWAWRAAKMANQ